MKCIECVAKGQTSTVSVGGSCRTCKYESVFYDEQGNIQRHNKNVTTTQYRCSKGHTFTGGENRANKASETAVKNENHSGPPALQTKIFKELRAGAEKQQPR